MTDTETKALKLLNDCGGDALVVVRNMNPWVEALCRAIEQHEAFRQEVSDVVEQALSFGDVESLRRKGVLSRFIIPKPKPDPLVAVLEKMGWYIAPNGPTDAENFRAELDALGFEIREKNDE